MGKFNIIKALFSLIMMNYQKGLSPIISKTFDIVNLFRTTGNNVNDIPIAYAWVFCFHVVEGPRKWP